MLWGLKGYNASRRGTATNSALLSGVVLASLLVVGGLSYAVINEALSSSENEPVGQPEDSSNADDPVNLIPAFSPAEIQSILAQRLPVYWLGREFAGLPVSGTNTQNNPPPFEGGGAPTNYISVSYGNCKLPTAGDEDHASCVVPLSVRTESYCSRRPEFMPDSLKGETLTLRGADAMWKVNYTGGQRAQLFLYTGDVTVTVHAPDEKVARQAADWLRSMNELGAQSERALLGGVTAICSE